MTVSARTLAALVSTAVLGGLVAVGAVALLGGLGGDTTVVTETIQATSTELGPANGAMSVNAIYETASPGVVQINSTTKSDASSSTAGEQHALGSGFVVDKSGHIVTNYHVVEGADQITVSFSNRDTVEATLIGTDPSTDLAVLRVGVNPKALTPASPRELRQASKWATRSSRSATRSGSTAPRPRAS